MRFVFYHGWGFDAAFWNRILDLLAPQNNIVVEEGYFGLCPRRVELEHGDVLIGHSRGCWQAARAALAAEAKGVEGLALVAINGFARFCKPNDTKNKEYEGCVPEAVLRAMKNGLARKPRKIMQDFYRLVGASEAECPAGAGLELGMGIDDAAALLGQKFCVELLQDGLQDLMTADLQKILANGEEANGQKMGGIEGRMEGCMGGSKGRCAGPKAWLILGGESDPICAAGAARDFARVVAQSKARATFCGERATCKSAFDEIDNDVIIRDECAHDEAETLIRVCRHEGGHLLPLKEPQWCVREIRKFLDDL